MWKYTEGNFQRKIRVCIIGMNPWFVSTLCAIRYETYQTFIIGHVWCHELFIGYAIWLHIMQDCTARQC